jgi:tetratricopeptide (TPR) repeat protein
VVAQFQNRTRDTSLEFVADLVAESISQGLASTGLVEVVPLGSGPVNGDQALTGSSGEMQESLLQALAEVANADIAISGAFYVEGEQLQLRARVGAVEDGRVIFAVPAIEAMRAAPGDGVEHLAQRVVGGLAMHLDNPLNMMLPVVPPTYEAFRVYRTGLERLLDGNKIKVPELMNNAAGLDSAFTLPLLLVPAVHMYRPVWWAEVDTALTVLEEMDERLSEYERLLRDAMRAMVDGNNQAALNFVQRVYEMAPDDLLVLMLKFLAHMDLNEPRKVLETYEAINLTDEFRRRNFGAGCTRFAANMAHNVGDYDRELSLRRKVVEYFPNLVLFHLDLLGPFAARGQLDSMRVVLRRTATMPGARGYHDWSVWTASDALRGHGFRDEAIQLVDEYLEGRIPRPDDANQPHLPNNHAELLLRTERWEEARAKLEENLTLDTMRPRDIDSARLNLALLAARRGERDVAERALAEAVEAWDNPYNSVFPFLLEAKFAALLGDKERAVRMLREVAAQGGTLGHHLLHDPELMSLHGYPPFEELTQPQG